MGVDRKRVQMPRAGQHSGQPNLWRPGLLEPAGLSAPNCCGALLQAVKGTWGMRGPVVPGSQAQCPVQWHSSLWVLGWWVVIRPLITAQYVPGMCNP